MLSIRRFITHTKTIKTVKAPQKDTKLELLVHDINMNRFTCSCTTINYRHGYQVTKQRTTL